MPQVWKMPFEREADLLIQVLELVEQIAGQRVGALRDQRVGHQVALKVEHQVRSHTCASLCDGTAF